jgi:hypothetical protein
MVEVDVANEVHLSQLCTKIIKRRVEARVPGAKVEVAGFGYKVSGYWVDNVFRVEVERIKPSSITDPKMSVVD